MVTCVWLIWTSYKCAKPKEGGPPALHDPSLNLVQLNIFLHYTSQDGILPFKFKFIHTAYLRVYCNLYHPP
jgi:hypothetical protein